MAAKTAEQKAEEAKAAEEQKAAEEATAAEEQKAAEAKAAEEAAAAQAAADGKPEDPQGFTGDTIPAAATSAPPVENAEAIAEAASPASVTSDDGLAPFRPPQTRHTAWTLNTLAESEGGSELGVEQTSGNADLTKDPADRNDEAE
jgi:hypothetical protein